MDDITKHIPGGVSAHVEVKRPPTSRGKCIFLEMLLMALPQDVFKLLTFSVFSYFFGVKFCFLWKISQNCTDLRCLPDIKVLTQQAKVAGALVTYCSGESSQLNSRTAKIVNHFIHSLIYFV